MNMMQYRGIQRRPSCRMAGVACDRWSRFYSSLAATCCRSTRVDELIGEDSVAVVES